MGAESLGRSSGPGPSALRSGSERPPTTGKPGNALAFRPLSVGLATVASVAVVALATAVGRWVLGGSVIDVLMIYLLGVVVVAMRFGYLASLIASMLSVGALDFFFTAPFYSFEVNDRRYILTFVIMLFVGLVISNLMERVRRSSERAAAVEVEMQKERLRNALLSSVSHDLRTPLAVIKGAVTSLLTRRGELTADRQLEYMETISDEASRMNQFVRNLLTMTSLEAGTMRATKQWQPIEEVVGVALNRLEELLAGRPVHIHIAEDAAFAAFDATLIEHVLTNLIENAVRYTPAATPVDIRATSVTGGVRVEVADRGPGVPEGKQEVIFEKFQRETPRVLGGLGLGLTLCRGIVMVHGGRMWCENRVGGGASFNFILPRDAEAPKMGELPER